MQSILDPIVIYQNVSRDICEHDVDVVSDLWNMDDRDVYRGSRDTQYSHANVYWLYSEELTRVGLIEHSLTNHANFRILWFYENPFATFLQEDGWTQNESIWSVLSQAAVERFHADEWITPEQILQACLHGDSRILTLDTVLNPPTVHGCSGCGTRSFKRLACENMTAELTFPTKEKIIFIDDDLFVCIPPSGSRVWELVGFAPTSLHPRAGDVPPSQVQGLQEPELELEPVRESPAPPPEPAPQSPSPEESALPEAHPPSPPAQTAEQPTRGPEQTPVHTRFATSLQIPARTRRYSG